MLLLVGVLASFTGCNTGLKGGAATSSSSIRPELTRADRIVFDFKDIFGDGVADSRHEITDPKVIQSAIQTIPKEGSDSASGADFYGDSVDLFEGKQRLASINVTPDVADRLLGKSLATVYLVERKKRYKR